MTDPLPRFSNPPVHETVMGLFFRPPAKNRAVFPSMVWSNCFREAYPLVEERPALEMSPDSFHGKTIPSRVEWRLSNRPDIPRLWASTPDDEHVVQIQATAFLCNWLRGKGSGVYREYLQRREDYLNKLRQVDDYSRRENFMDGLSPTSGLMTYINQIPCDEGTNPTLLMAKLLRACHSPVSDGWLPSPQEVVYQAVFPLPGQRGAMEVTAQPALFTPEGKPLVQLELTVRGSLVDKTLDDAMSWMDLAHEWIVRGFKSLTTPEMHQKWGIQT